jgi:hypothetical protein
MATVASDETSASSDSAADNDEDRETLGTRSDRTATEEELIMARLRVAQQEEELTLLRTNRTKMEAEVQELTASLFEVSEELILSHFVPFFFPFYVLCVFSRYCGFFSCFFFLPFLCVFSRFLAFFFAFLVFSGILSHFL